MSSVVQTNIQLIPLFLLNLQIALNLVSASPKPIPRVHGHNSGSEASLENRNQKGCVEANLDTALPSLEKALKPSLESLHAKRLETTTKGPQCQLMAVVHLLPICCWAQIPSPELAHRHRLYRCE